MRNWAGCLIHHRKPVSNLALLLTPNRSRYRASGLVQRPSLPFVDVRPQTLKRPFRSRSRTFTVPKNGRQPTRDHERRMRGSRVPERTQAFFASFSPIRQHVAIKRHRLRASLYANNLPGDLLRGIASPNSSKIRLPPSERLLALAGIVLFSRQRRCDSPFHAITSPPNVGHPDSRSLRHISSVIGYWLEAWRAFCGVERRPYPQWGNGPAGVENLAATFLGERDGNQGNDAAETYEKDDRDIGTIEGNQERDSDKWKWTTNQCGSELVTQRDTCVSNFRRETANNGPITAPTMG
jgi:hypothetical protein